MSWVAAAVASAGLTFAGVQAIKGKRDQKKDEKNRPKYNMPDEYNQNLVQAKADAMIGVPEAAQQEYLSNMERGTAYGLSELGSRNAGLTGVAALNQNQNDAYASLMSADANAIIGGRRNIMNARGQIAEGKDAEFQFNTVNPYYEGIARKQARNAAFFQNAQKSTSMGLGAMGSGGAFGGGGKKSGGGSPDYVGPDMNDYDGYGGYT